MTRLRQHETAFATLQKPSMNPSASLPVLEEQMEKQGIAGMTDAQWRENTRRSRIQTARTGMEVALEEMGSAVNIYFTPEERLDFRTICRVQTQWYESRRCGNVRNSAGRERRSRRPGSALAF
jgi:hypothetical protein